MAPKPNVEFGRLTINFSNDLNSLFQILNPRQGIATIDSLTRTVGACHGPRAQAHAMLDKVLGQTKGDIVTFMYSILPTASTEADSQQITRQQTVKVEQPPSLPLRDMAPPCTHPPNMSMLLQPTYQPQGPVYDVHDVNMPYSQPQGPGHPTAMGMPLGYNLQAPSYPGTTISPYYHAHAHAHAQPQPLPQSLQPQAPLQPQRTRESDHRHHPGYRSESESDSDYDTALSHSRIEHQRKPQPPLQGPPRPHVDDVNMPGTQSQGHSAGQRPPTEICRLGLEVPKDSIETDDQRNVRAPSIRLKRESSEALGRNQPPPSRRDHHEDHRPHNPPHGRPSRHRSHGQYRHNPLSVPPARRPQARTDTSRSLPTKEKPDKHTHPLLGQDEWTKRDGENRDLTCGNCGLRGHILLDCLWPDQDGWIQGCPLCNSKEHHLEGCDRMQRLTERDMFGILVLRRANKPPLKTTEAWIEWVVLALERRWIRKSYMGFPNIAAECRAIVRSTTSHKPWIDYDYSNDTKLQRTKS
ncbi:hypothetical protein GQ607_013304 [Colletotrichum asianum]|uniref:CCHC-type domain-containing protein n=1 Tax=Colletotrichum asianum TaxID=702518 RepID=A0A8H3W416_9PEZI|nr:hypothetical protein GQ607_013304 [Colletotrichum asianum]